MTRVELAAAAVEDLDALILTHSLPADTRARVVRALRPLERLPLIGPALNDRWAGFRILLGPWRWLLVVYVFVESEDRVVGVTIQDGRSSPAATASRRLTNPDDRPARVGPRAAPLDRRPPDRLDSHT